MWWLAKVLIDDGTFRLVQRGERDDDVGIAGDECGAGRRRL